MGGRRRVRPDAVLEAPEVGVSVLMVEVDRSTMSSAWVAAKFAGYRELFRTRTRDNDPALAGETAAAGPTGPVRWLSTRTHALRRRVCHGAAMTDAPHVPARPRRRPWSSRTALVPDLCVGFALFVVEAIGFAWNTFIYGVGVWEARDSAVEDAALLREIAWTWRLLVTALVLAALALIARARWTAVLQVLAAAGLAVVLALSQHSYDRTHPVPGPTPEPGYSPCYSGSGTCL
ncbi:DUF6234 family protein [Kitasatospora sp. NPDC090308]|uniref:DUF6234 family protein n=1 Tax=Kitasatospora sp. NPDC090308 TaxID=3364082 RepID=UPI0038163ED9